jgi:riboflavin kinase/FMN adenylyltransferase
VSSTRVREAIAAGRLEEAKALLGRDFRISGRVIEGQARPHARISHGEPAAAPPRVAGCRNLAVRVTGAGCAAPGVASVGTRPTVGGTEWLLEVHLFDYDGELYGERLCVDFIARLRDEIRFADVEAMTAQMHEDARLARKLLAARG